MTCFLSKSWATRLASLEKVSEQLPNLDPSQRDPMTAEINRQNLPVEINFKTFIEFISEGLKDPVLKNFLQILTLFQESLPIFFRHLPAQTIRQSLGPVME